MNRILADMAMGFGVTGCGQGQGQVLRSAIQVMRQLPTAQDRADDFSAIGGQARCTIEAARQVGRPHASWFTFGAGP